MIYRASVWGSLQPWEEFPQVVFSIMLDEMARIEALDLPCSLVANISVDRPRLLALLQNRLGDLFIPSQNLPVNTFAIRMTSKFVQLGPIPANPLADEHPEHLPGVLFTTAQDPQIIQDFNLIPTRGGYDVTNGHLTFFIHDAPEAYEFAEAVSKLGWDTALKKCYPHGFRLSASSPVGAEV